MKEWRDCEAMDEDADVEDGKTDEDADDGADGEIDARSDRSYDGDSSSTDQDEPSRAISVSRLVRAPTGTVSVKENGQSDGWSPHEAGNEETDGDEVEFTVSRMSLELSADEKLCVE